MFTRKPSLSPDKLKLIDFAFEKMHAKSFIDLGGVWGVEAGYTFYALQKYPIQSAFLVDNEYTDKTIKESKKHKNLKTIQGNFGDPKIANQLGKVDVTFLFDVLLHQVNPDWKEIIEMYATKTVNFLVFNPQWVKGNRTVRLLDLGKEEYLRNVVTNVPFHENSPSYQHLFDDLDAINPQSGKKWRDLSYVWQWGITDEDLIDKMKELGFKMHYHLNCGPFSKDPNLFVNFENHAFAFKRN